jgi:hypothetical protein
MNADGIMVQGDRLILRVRLNIRKLELFERE